MKQTLSISVSKKPVNAGAVSVRNLSVSERLMRFMFVDKLRLTVIVPGNTVEELSIHEVAEGGLAHEYCMRTGEYTRSTADFYNALESAGFSRRKAKAGIIVYGLRIKEEDFEG